MESIEAVSREDCLSIFSRVQNPSQGGSALNCRSTASNLAEKVGELSGLREQLVLKI